MLIRFASFCFQVSKLSLEASRVQAWRFQLALAVASQVGDGPSSLEQKAGEAGERTSSFAFSPIDCKYKVF